jgi:hypothetical protein
MRHVRLKFGVVTMLCAFAVAATPAMAHEFISSGGETRGKGEEQEMKLGPFKITCANAHSKGGPTTPLSSPTFFTSVTFGKCKTEAKIGANPIFLKTKFMTPLAIEYHANGFVEIGSEGEEVEGNTVLGGGTVEVKVSAIKCVISWPTQTIPAKAEKKPLGEYESAFFSNEEVEKGKNTFNKLDIENEFKGIHFSYGAGQCEEFEKSETEIKSGSYKGELLEEVRKGGNLEFQ